MASRAINGRERWTVTVRRGLESRVAGVAVVLLILGSVGLTIWELALPPRAALSARVSAWNHAITLVFVVELALRFWSARDRAGFWREYWFDILAVLPAVRVVGSLYGTNLLRLLRLLRLFRIAQMVSDHTGNLPYILRRVSVEYSLLLCFLLFVVIFGAAAMLLAEQGSNRRLDSISEAIWWCVYTLLAGESVTEYPSSVPGRLIGLLVIFLGMGVFALVTGTVSAVMVERLTRHGERPMDLDTLRGHTLICGFSRKVAMVLDELVGSEEGNHRRIVLVAEAEHGDAVRELCRRHAQLHWVNGDFTRADVLEKAGAATCDTCIIVSDRNRGRAEQDADARTILAALTMEKLNSKVFTCAELNNSDYISHLERGGVDDVVIGGEHSAMLLAQAAICHGLGDVVSELLSVRRGSRFYKAPVPPRLVGRKFGELLIELKEKHGCILVGYEDAEGGQCLNPAAYVAAAGDNLIVIAAKRVDLR